MPLLDEAVARVAARDQAVATARREQARGALLQAQAVKRRRREVLAGVHQATSPTTSRARLGMIVVENDPSLARMTVLDLLGHAVGIQGARAGLYLDATGIPHTATVGELVDFQRLRLQAALRLIAPPAGVH